MITRVQVKNYRSLRDVDVTLGPLNVLVGRNGAGKSAFLDVLAFVRDALRFNLETALGMRGGLQDITFWSSRNRSPLVSFRIESENDDGHQRLYEFAIRGERSQSYKVVREHGFAEAYTYDSDGIPDYDGEEMEIKNGAWMSGYWFIEEPVEPIRHRAADISVLHLARVPDFYANLGSLSSEIRSSTHYAVFPNAIREPQRATNETILADNASNLAVVVKTIIFSEKKQELVYALQKLVPDIIDIRVISAGAYLVIELRHLAESKREKWIPLVYESDGTLRLLGLLALLYQSRVPSLIAIEEPELAIHPGALAFLSDLIQEASLRAQIIITTQSPDLISRFAAGDLRIVENVRGETNIGLIEERQRAVINAELFSGGDLLRIEGLRPAGLANV